MPYQYVGSHPDFLDTGRPIVFGDLVDDQDACERLMPVLVPLPQAAPAKSAPAAPAAPAPSAPAVPAAPESEAKS